MPGEPGGRAGNSAAHGMRLMAVHAHPDDESSKGAATTARYVADGADVMVVSCTGGERGDILNPQLKDDPHILRDLAQVRRDEMAAAQAILGCGHTWLGFVDSGLPEGDPLPPLPAGCFALEPISVTTEALVRVVREFRPHVMTTYDERGGYPHPDHINCHVVSMAAFEAAGDPDAYPDAGEPWQPLKIYYNHTFTRSRIEAFDEAMRAEGLESPYTDWLKDWKRDERRITTKVPCGEWFEVRDRALLAHATQVDPDGAWFKVPLELQRRVWPTEDYELALSFAPFVEGEDDVFAGLGSPDEADAWATRGGLTVAYDGRTALESVTDMADTADADDADGADGAAADADTLDPETPDPDSVRPEAVDSEDVDSKDVD